MTFAATAAFCPRPEPRDDASLGIPPIEVLELSTDSVSWLLVGWLGGGNDPSDEPSDELSDYPSDDLFDDPNDEPSDDPTKEPLDDPTNDPADEPTDDPTDDPSDDPTDDSF